MLLPLSGIGRNSASYAESASVTVSDEIGRTSEVRGDVNADGEFNIANVVTLQNWLLQKPGTQLKNWKVADLCTDGKLNVFDLCLMKREFVNKGK